MSNAVFIDDWNSVIPFKIKAADLEKPTELFLYKAVLNFFKLMHYDVSSYENMYNESIESRTVKRVELVARINHIYQLCSDSKQTSFFYVDLIKPTAKKVTHLLKILLNYLFYINMVKETVLEKANLCTEKYFELSAKLNQEQIAKEESKIRANNMNRHIDDLKNQLPKVKNIVETLIQRKDGIHGKLVTVKANHQELADRIVKLRIEHAELAERKVTDEEVGALKATNEALERDIELLSATETQLQKENAIHVTAISQMRPCIVLLEKLLKLPFEDSCKIVQSDEGELQLHYDEAKNKYNELLSMFHALTTNCTEIETDLEERKKELDVRRKVLSTGERKQDCKMIEHEKYVADLDETNALLERILKEQTVELERIIKMLEASLKIIKKSLI